MSFTFRCGLRRCALPVVAAVAVMVNFSGQVACAQSAAASAPAGNTAFSARDLRLRAETAQLQLLAAQLQQALDKSGDDKLSLEVVRLSQQTQALARQIEVELSRP